MSRLAKRSFALGQSRADPARASFLSDKTQVEWIKSYINALEELRKYIMQFHTTALTWTPKVSVTSELLKLVGDSIRSL